MRKKGAELVFLGELPDGEEVIDFYHAGTLRFDDREGGTLRLTVPMVVQAPPRLKQPLILEDSTIVGVTTKGELVTLIGCYQKSSNLNLQGGPRSVEVYANAVIQGFHCDQDPLLNTVSVSLRSLNDWWGHSSIKDDPSVEFPNIAVYGASAIKCW